MNGYDIGGDAATTGLNLSSGPQQEIGDPLYVKVRENMESGGGAKEKEGKSSERGDEQVEEESGDGDDGSSLESGGRNTGTSSSSVSSSSPSTKATKGDRTAGAGGRGGGIFGWLRKITAASAAAEAPSKNEKKEAKRERSDETEQDQEEEGESTSMSTTTATGGDGGGDEGEDRTNKRRRRAGDTNAGDGSLASPSSNTKSALDESSRGRGSFFSPNRMLRGRWGSSAVDPWRRHDKTLRVVAEHQARTLLFRRARLRAQVRK